MESDLLHSEFNYLIRYQIEKNQLSQINKSLAKISKNHGDLKVDAKLKRVRESEQHLVEESISQFYLTFIPYFPFTFLHILTFLKLAFFNKVPFGNSGYKYNFSFLSETKPTTLPNSYNAQLNTLESHLIFFGSCVQPLDEPHSSQDCKGILIDQVLSRHLSYYQQLLPGKQRFINNKNKFSQLFSL